MKMYTDKIRNKVVTVHAMKAHGGGLALLGCNFITRWGVSYILWLLWSLEKEFMLLLE
jgi:hypothetical protein